MCRSIQDNWWIFPYVSGMATFFSFDVSIIIFLLNLYLLFIHFIHCISRLILGLRESWKRKKFKILGVEWSYEKAMICKGYECSLEACLQVLLQTYIQMRTGWLGMHWLRDLTKGYKEDGGTRNYLQKFKVFKVFKPKYFAVWRYYKGMKFSMVQIIGSLSYPSSFISLLLGTISWHFHVREVILDNLSLTHKLKVVPFFFSITVTKVWTMAHLINTLTSLAETNIELQLIVYMVKLLPCLITITSQFILHWKMRFSFQTTILGSLANLTTLWRPTHDESQNQKTIRYYKNETLLSSCLTIIFALINVTLDYTLVPRDEGISWSSWTALTIACTNYFITRLYTRCLMGTLFPNDLLMSKDTWDHILKLTSTIVIHPLNEDGGDEWEMQQQHPTQLPMSRILSAVDMPPIFEKSANSGNTYSVKMKPYSTECLEEIYKCY